MGAWEYAAEIDNFEVLTACRLLFGADVVLNEDFLVYLQLDGAKSAYRKRARESHPDAHPWVNRKQLQILEHEFAAVSAAYRKLSAFLKNRPTITETFSDNNMRYRFHKNGIKQTDQPPRYTGSPQRYAGPIPSVKLKIGRYLYFTGIASFQAIVEALSWQRMQRPSIGVLARNTGWLMDADVHHILQSENVKGRFGERALQLGLLKPWQLAELLKQQQSRQERLGQYFVRYHGVSDYKMNLLNDERIKHNTKICGY